MADIIDQLSAMDDAALSAKLGFDAKLADARKDLARAAALPADARKDVAESIKRQFEPNVYPGDWRWQIDDAERRCKKKSAAEEMCDCEPSSLMPD